MWEGPTLPMPGPAELRESWLWQLVGYAALDYDDTERVDLRAPPGGVSRLPQLSVTASQR